MYSMKNYSVINSWTNILWELVVQWVWQVVGHTDTRTGTKLDQSVHKTIKCTETTHKITWIFKSFCTIFIYCLFHSSLWYYCNLPLKLWQAVSLIIMDCCNSWEKPNLGFVYLNLNKVTRSKKTRITFSLSFKQKSVNFSS